MKTKFLLIIIALSILSNVKAQSDNDLWKSLNENLENNLPKSAATILDELEQKAVKENNQKELLKTFLYRFKIFYLEDDDAVEASIQFAEENISRLQEPERAIFNLAIASLYEDCQQTTGNRQQTSFIEFLENALSDVESLQKNTTESYKDILTIYDKMADIDFNIEPTLYDYVIHKIVNYKENSYSRDVSMIPAKINNISLLRITDLYQDLIDFDKKNNYEDAAIYNEIQKLKYEYNNSDDFETYFNSLENIKNNIINNPLVTSVMALQAEAILSQQPIANNQSSIAKILSICDGAIKLFPESKGAKQCESIRSEILQKELSLTMQNVQLPNKDITAKLTYRNLTNPHYRIYKVSQNDLEKLNKKCGSELVRELYKKELIVENHIEILDKKDYQEHEISISLPKLDCGTYFIVFSKDDKFSKKDNELPAIHLFQVSNLSFVTTKENDDFVIYVLDRDSGKPIRNVNVNIFDKTYDYDKRKYVDRTLADLTTDKNGTALIPDIKTSSFNVNLFKGDDKLLSDRSTYFYNYHEKGEEKLRERTFFFTDRTIYRPGQTVYYKGVILNENSQMKELLVGKETTVVFKDSNFQDVASQTFTTNEFGSFDGSFIIPNNVSNGYFQITNESGSLAFKVEEYKRPTFEVTFDNPDKSFKLNEEVELSGSVKAYAGFGLDNVNYKYTVVRRAYFPYRFWWFADYSDNEKQIAFGDGTTDEKGNFNISFNLIPDKKDKGELPVYEYIVTVDVTNAQGETQSKTYTLKASDIDLIIDINNRSEVVSKDSLDLITFNVKNLKENPVEAKLIRKIYRINDNSQQSTVNRLCSVEIIYEDIIDVNGSCPLFPNVKNFVNNGRFLVELISADNEKIKTSVKLTIIDLESDEIPCDTMCISYSDKESVQPGEDVNFYLGSSAKDVNVYVMIKHGDEVRYYERKTLSDKVLKFSYKIKEEDRGRISFQAFFVKNNTINIEQQDVFVPYDNLKLDIRLDVERDDLLPASHEKWNLTIKNFKDEGVVANLLAGMYDASLDVFAKNSWFFPVEPNIMLSAEPRYDNSFDNFFCAANNQSFRNYSLFAYNLMSDMTLTPFVGSRRNSVITARQLMSMSAHDIDAISASVGGVEMEYSVYRIADSKENIAAKAKLNIEEFVSKDIENQEPVLRENFNETAFFYPNLITNDDGSLTFSFTMPDALTRWNLMMLAYTKDLKTGTLNKTFTTSKPLMIMSDMPRFCYENDTLWMVANVIKTTDNGQQSTDFDQLSKLIAKLEIFDALTMQPLDLILSDKEINIDEIPAGESRAVRWKVAIGKGVAAHVQTNLLAFRFSVNAENFSDAEQHLLPILSDEVFMTETYPMTVKANSEEKYNFDFNNENERNQGLTLNFCANPKWYAIQSLPYLSQEIGESADVAFNIFYANSLASYIAHNTPNLLNYIKKWQIESPDELMSQLQKDENLKAIMLEETPWVLEAKSEAEQKSRLANLFDVNAMSYKTTEALNLISEKQSVNGGWSWFPNMPESSFITQNILSGFGKLHKMNVINALDLEQQSIVNNICDKAIKYLTNEIIEAYNDIKYKGKFHSSPNTINELYALSFFDFGGNEKFDEAKEFFLSQLQKDWQKFDFGMQAKIALVLHRNGNDETAQLIMQSLRERARQKEDVGMYWSSDVKEQTIIMEALREISPDEQLLEEATIWLLCNKRCNMWENAATTVDAIYELMIGEYQLSSVSIQNNSVIIQASDNNATDNIFIQKNWNADEMSDFKDLTIENKTDNLVWGGLFRQYFVSIDEVRKHESPLNVERELFVERNNENGSYLVPIKETELKVGDKVVVNLTIESIQDMEFVFLKDLRAACLEPTQQMSRYNYSDGMYYYQSNSDTFMGFYFDRLPKGKHCVSYSMFVTKEGNFSNGYALIQCMYSPEFSAYSEGMRLEVSK
ncbi:MAG: hypothetical protein IJZ06_08480 [Bacteroidales bacterium]|nr:hypothetical protein [Bacteroidales bacterium]